MTINRMKSQDGEEAIITEANVLLAYVITTYEDKVHRV